MLYMDPILGVNYCVHYFTNLDFSRPFSIWFRNSQLCLRIKGLIVVKLRSYFTRIFFVEMKISHWKCNKQIYKQIIPPPPPPPAPPLPASPLPPAPLPDPSCALEVIVFMFGGTGRRPIPPGGGPLGGTGWIERGVGCEPLEKVGWGAQESKPPWQKKNTNVALVELRTCNRCWTCSFLGDGGLA